MVWKCDIHWSPPGKNLSWKCWLTRANTSLLGNHHHHQGNHHYQHDVHHYHQDDHQYQHDVHQHQEKSQWWLWYYWNLWAWTLFPPAQRKTRSLKHSKSASKISKILLSDFKLCFICISGCSDEDVWEEVSGADKEDDDTIFWWCQ